MIGRNEITNRLLARASAWQFSAKAVKEGFCGPVAGPEAGSFRPGDDPEVGEMRFRAKRSGR